MQPTILRAALCGALLTSACLMAQAPAEYLEVTRAQVKGDKVKEYEDLVKKVVEMNRKYKGDRWIALTTEYGDFGGYIFTSARDNFAAVESGQTNFMKALKEGLGPLSEKVMRDFSAYSASGRSEIRRRRWDLSVNAPATAAGLLDLVAKSRFVRTQTIRLKPGHTMEYLDAWKGFQNELKGVTPAMATLVSQSNTGAPSVFVSVYYRSFAEMDANSPGVQKATGTDAYRKLMEVTRQAVDSSAWEIARIRPELSNPPDEIVAADAAFWKPKPMTAPKPAAPAVKQ